MRYQKILLGIVKCGVISLLLGAIMFLSYDYLQVGRNVSLMGENVRPIAASVLRVHYLGPIIGEYWEDQLLEQAPVVAKLSLKERNEFFAIVLTFCDLSNYRAIYFTEMIEKDAEELQNYLARYVNTSEYERLPPEAKGRIKYWIDFMPTAIEQRDAVEYAHPKQDETGTK